MAQTEIDITGGRVDPLPIAISPFLAGGGAEESAATISAVITNDLGRSGYFAPLDPATFIEKITSFDQTPNFASWKQIQAKALVTGQAFMDGGKMRVEFRLWDVNTGQQLAAQQFTTTPKNDRRIGHMIADIIYKQLTGIDGYFDTRIVFVTEDGPKDKRVKKLAIMDQDGFNIRPLTDGKDLVLTPRFSPSTNEITYMSFGNAEPRVYLMNIDTKQREIVGAVPQHELRAALLARRPARHHEPRGQWQRQHLRARPALAQRAPADQRAGHQHRALLFAGRHARSPSSRTAAAPSRST